MTLANVTNLRIFKEEALEQLAENEIVIASQKERIAELEFHLAKCRDSAYLIVTATAGVLPASYAPDKKTKGKK